MEFFEKGKHLGGTGTSEHVTPYQIQKIATLLKGYYQSGYRIFHHGDCIKADALMHEIAVATGYGIVIHPPIYSAKRAFCKTGNPIILPPFPYLTRNHHTVEAVSQMIAVPKEKEEQLRSGTWATVRYARKMRVPINYVYP